jgi:16S rRNA processing protein RimM
MPSPAEDSVAIGKIQKTHGRRGEVAADILTDFPDRFGAGERLLLSDGNEVEPRLVEASRFHKGRVILKLAGCDSMEAAETLVGRWVVVSRESRRRLPPGVVYLADLIGCTVRETGQTLGIVEAIEETAGAPVLLRVRTPEGELLVPFAAEICRRVDVAKREIEVRLPEGLRELNRETAAPKDRGERPRRFRRRGSRRNRESS